jgi:hypothetical protein
MPLNPVDLAELLRLTVALVRELPLCSRERLELERWLWQN